MRALRLSILLTLSLLSATCAGNESPSQPQTTAEKTPPSAAQPAPSNAPAPTPAPASSQTATPTPAKTSPAAEQSKALTEPPAQIPAASTSTAQPSSANPTPNMPAQANPAPPVSVPQPAVASPPAQTPPKNAPAVAPIQRAPDNPIILKSALGGVRFEHKSHTETRKAACETCHHPSKPEKPSTVLQQPCRTCHTPVPAPPMKTKLQAAFHNPTASAGTCIDCHKAESAKGQAPPTKCLECHKKENK